MTRKRKCSRMPISLENSRSSPFLRLPAEIRNSIYELCATNTETICVRLDGLLYLPPLSLVCHQVREEFQQIYIDEAPRYATTAVIHLTNFVHKTATRDIADTFAALPSLTVDTDRRYVVHLFLTNTFDHYLNHLRSLSFPPVASQGAGCPVEVRYEPKTFDVHYCQQLLPKMRWSIGEHTGEISRRDWRETEKAFEEAFERYQPKTKLSNVRKRKRQ